MVPLRVLSRCVRRAFLLGDGQGDGTKWVENRLEELADASAIAVGEFSVVAAFMRCAREPLSRRLRLSLKDPRYERRDLSFD